MSLLHTIVAFIVALGVLIVVHEYGHYLAARLCRVKVLRFSVGFGRSLATWRLGADRTEWVIAAVPFGGYVKMLDEREGPVSAEEAARAFNRQNVWKRFFIVVAGPTFNFLFAVLVYAGLFDGRENASYELKNERGYVHVARGRVTVNGHRLEAGDALKTGKGVIEIKNGEGAEVLVFDLP